MKKIVKLAFSIAMLLTFSGCSGDKEKEVSSSSSNFINDGYITAYKDKKAGLINEENKVIIDFKYDNCYYMKNDEIVVASKGGALEDGEIKNSKWGLIDTNEKVIIDFKYDELSHLNNNRNIITKDNKQGVIDNEENIIIEAKYDQIYYNWVSDVYTVMADVQRDDSGYIERARYGLLDADGEEIFPCKYQDMTKISDELYVVALNDKYGVIDIKGKEVLDIQYGNISIVSRYNAEKKIYENVDGKLIVEKDDKEGVIDKSGKEIIPIEYDTYKFEEVTEDDYTYDRTIQNGIDYQEKVDVFIVSKEGKQGVIDVNGKVLVDCIYTSIRVDENGFLGENYDKALEDDFNLVKEYNYLDKDGEKIITIRAHDAKMFNAKGVAIVRPEYSENYTLMNRKGEKLIEKGYSDIYSTLEDDCYMVEEGYYESGVIDTTGKEIIPVQEDVSINIVNNKYEDYSQGEVEVGEIEPVIIVSNITHNGELGTIIFYDMTGKEIKKIEGNLSNRYKYIKDAMLFDVDKGHMDEEYDEYGYAYNREYVSETDGQVYGLLDYKGNVVIEPKYIEVEERYDYYACIRKDGDSLVDKKTLKVKMQLDKDISLVRDREALIEEIREN